MALRGGKPIRFTPQGLCDAFDSTNTFQGACTSLQNLVFDQGNPELIVSRPGVVLLTNFPGFTTPTYVSGFIAVGTMIYGMVSTGLNAGHDQPFAYNILTNTFVTISGITSANTPVSPSTSGAWTPPTFAVVSTDIIVTHPGFSGTSNAFGVINISTPATPSWVATNTATNPLPAPPSAVANFNNRAYYAVGNVLYFSDVLAPVTRTNATQSVTLGDTTPVTALSGLPVTTTSSGVVGALIAFKASQVWQITGDPTTNTLALNFLTLTTGTQAPRSVVQIPFGIVFAASDGPYTLSFLGSVVKLTKQDGPLGGEADIQLPFQNTTTPSRMAATFAANVYRVCIPTELNGIAATNDYWFDIGRRRWNGPHTFPYDCAAQVLNYSVISSPARGAALFQSQSIPSLSTVYTDNGTPITVNLMSSSFPKTQNMAEIQVVESTIELASSGAAVQYNITAVSTQNTPLNSCAITTPQFGKTWGSGWVWGDGTLWSSSVNIPLVYQIPWTSTLVFQKMALNVTATAQSNLSIGTFFARYQETGFTLQPGLG